MEMAGEDVLLQIMMRLSPADVCRARAVSRAWRCILSGQAASSYVEASGPWAVLQLHVAEARRNPSKPISELVMDAPGWRVQKLGREVWCPRSGLHFPFNMPCDVLAASGGLVFVAQVMREETRGGKRLRGTYPSISAQVGNPLTNTWKTLPHVYNAGPVRGAAHMETGGDDDGGYSILLHTQKKGMVQFDSKQGGDGDGDWVCCPPRSSSSTPGIIKGTKLRGSFVRWKVKPCETGFQGLVWCYSLQQRSWSSLWTRLSVENDFREGYWDQGVPCGSWKTFREEGGCIIMADVVEHEDSGDILGYAVWKLKEKEDAAEWELVSRLRPEELLGEAWNQVALRYVRSYEIHIEALDGCVFFTSKRLYTPFPGACPPIAYSLHTGVWSTVGFKPFVSYEGRFSFRPSLTAAP